MTTSPPHPSSTLVNIAEDADARLIRVLVPSVPDPAAFEEACAAAVAAGDAARLLRTVLDSGAVAGLVRGDAYTVDEAVGAFSLLTVYLDRVCDAAAAREMCGLLAAAVVAADEGGEGNAEKRAAMVAALFNLRGDGGEKARLLAEVVNLADAAALTPGGVGGAAPLADLLVADELRAELARWGGVEAAELRTLYRAVSQGMDRVLARLAEAKEDKTTATKIAAATDRKQTYMLLFLETYKNGVSVVYRPPCQTVCLAAIRQGDQYEMSDICCCAKDVLRPLVPLWEGGGVTLGCWLFVVALMSIASRL